MASGFGTAPHRIGSDWYTRTGRKLNPKGQHYWDTQYRLGAVTLDGHYNHAVGDAIKQARTAPTRAGRVAAGKRYGAYSKAQQDKLQAQGEAGLSIATLGASQVVGAVGKDLVTSIQKRHPTLSASKKLGNEWVVDPVKTAIKHPSAKNIAFGGLAAAGVLPGFGAAGRGARAIREAGRVDKAALATKRVMHLPNSQPDPVTGMYRGGYIEKPVVYLRFGDLPRGKSKNHLTGGNEAGVSVYPAWYDKRTGKYVLQGGGEQYIGTQQALAGERSGRIHLVTGKELVDVGNDGEPLLHHRSVKSHHIVNPNDIVTDSDPWLSITGNELPRDQIPDWHLPEPELPGGAGRTGKIQRAGLEGHNALVAGDAVAQLGPVQGLARPVSKLAARVSYSRPYARVIGAHARVAKAMGRNLVHDQLRIKAANAIHLRRISKLKGADNVAHYWWAQVGPKLRNVEGLRVVKNRLHVEEHYIKSGHAEADLHADLEEVTNELRNVQFGTPDYYAWIAQKGSIENRLRDLPNAARNLEIAVGKLETTIRKNPKYNPEVINSIRTLEKDRREIGIASGKLDPEQAANRQGMVMDWLGHQPTGEEVYIGHRLGIESPPPEGLVPRSPGGGRVKLPRGWSSRNERILLNTGRVDQDVHTAIRDWQAAHAYRGTVRARHETGQMGTDYHGEQVDWNKYALINPKGKVIPSGWKVNEIAKLEHQGFDQEEIRKIADESMKQWLIDNPQAYQELVTLNHGNPIPGLRLVRKEDLNRYFAQMGAGMSSKVERVYDQALSAVMMQLIFARAGYIPKNLLQNAVMIVPHQGLMVTVNMPRAAQIAPLVRGAARVQSDTDRKLWDILQNAHGSGGATAGATAGLKEQGAIGRTTHAVSGAVTAVADAVPRTSAVIHELAKRGYVSKFSPHLSEDEKLAVIKLFESKTPSDIHIVRDIEQASKEAMGDFNRLSPGQRRWLRRFFIVPNWLVAGTRWPAHFALNHPVKTAAIGGAAYYGFGGPGMPTQGHPPLRLAKGVPPWAIGLETPWGVERLGSIIPASIPGDVLLAASQGNWIDVAQYANPMLTAIAMSFAGFEEYPTFAKKVGVSRAVWANMKRLIPNYKLFMDLKNGSGSTTYPGDSSIIGRLRRETGILPIPIAREGGGYGDAGGGGAGVGGDFGGGGFGGSFGGGNF